METLNNISKKTEKVTEWITALLMAVMVVVIFLQVIIRIIKGALPWSEEIARYFQIYLTFLGMSIGVRRMELVAVEVFVEYLPERLKKYVSIFVDILISALMIIMIVYGSKMAGIASAQKSPVLKINMMAVYYAVVIGFILMLYHNIVNILNKITGYKDTQTQEVTE